MKTAITAFLAVCVISSIGIWGCSQQKNDAQARKIRDLESRHAKLEEDYRTVVASAEINRKKLARLDLQRVEQSQQLEELKLAVQERNQAQLERGQAVQERDDLRQKLASRTTERDNVQSQFMQFSRDLQTLAKGVETAAAQANSGNGAPVAVPAPPAAKTN